MLMSTSQARKLDQAEARRAREEINILTRSKSFAKVLDQGHFREDGDPCVSGSEGLALVSRADIRCNRCGYLFHFTNKSPLDSRKRNWQLEDPDALAETCEHRREKVVTRRERLIAALDREIADRTRVRS